MAFQRGKYGIEYTTRKKKDPPVIRWIVFCVALVALISFTATKISRSRKDKADAKSVQLATEGVKPPKAAVAQPPSAQEVKPPPQKPSPNAVKVSSGMIAGRPAKLQNLLMRLKEAEKTRDLEMAVTTIEQIRALPGSPAADLDDALARRLGNLNLQWLFVKKNAQWVKQIEIKRGDSATRIAIESGSTLASLQKLNGGNVEKIVVGRKLYVMNHPRFNLVVRRRMGIADLSLNGKFFKRYDLIEASKGKDGVHEVPARIRPFWLQIGIGFSHKDRAEIEMLLPKGATVVISEL